MPQSCPWGRRRGRGRAQAAEGKQAPAPVRLGTQLVPLLFLLFFPRLTLILAYRLYEVQTVWLVQQWYEEEEQDDAFPLGKGQPMRVGPLLFLLPPWYSLGSVALVDDDDDDAFLPSGIETLNEAGDSIRRRGMKRTNATEQAEWNSAQSAVPVSNSGCLRGCPGGHHS